MRTFLMMALSALLGSVLAAPVRAQNQQSSSAPAPAAAPSSNSTAPSTSASAPASIPDTPDAPAKPAPKKVWTNDDFGPNAANSAKKPKPAKPEAKAVKGKNAASYRAQIQKLNSQIADLDKQIATYQAALNGEPSANAALQQYHMRAADWRAEIEKLTQQKQDLYAKITAVEDQARHDGIEPGELR